MKQLLVLSLLAVFSLNAHAQYLDMKGLTVQATSLLYIENNEPKSKTVDQAYAASFTDKILTHIIYSEGSITESQIYQIQNATNYTKGDETVYKFEALSGISGNRYYYEIKIDKDGKLISLILTQASGTKEVYKGGIKLLKTFKQ